MACGVAFAAWPGTWKSSRGFVLTRSFSPYLWFQVPGVSWFGSRRELALRREFRCALGERSQEAPEGSEGTRSAKGTFVSGFLLTFRMQTDFLKNTRTKLRLE